MEFELGTHNRLMTALFVSLIAIQAPQTAKNRPLAVTRMRAVSWL
jgi:hypothetical protein